MSLTPPIETGSKDASLRDILSYVETVGKFAVGVPIICYVIGLFVLNLHLWQYGYFSPSLFRLKYVAAGAWALLLPSLIASVALFTVAVARSVLRAETRKVVVIAAILFCPSLLFGLMFTAANLLKIHFSNHWGGSLVLAVLLVGLIAYTSIPLTSKNREHKQDGVLFGAVGILPILTVGLLYLHSFSTKSYHTIPAAVGGGMPQEVQLLFERDAKDDMLLLGLEFEDNSQLTSPMSLVLVTGEEYVVITTPPKMKGTSHSIPYRAVSVSRRLVKAAFYEVWQPR